MKAIQKVEQDMLVARMKHDAKCLHAKYNALLSRTKVLEQERDAIAILAKTNTSHKIEPMFSSGTGEATAVIMASDWHSEERVRPETVNGKNNFTLEIATKRANELFANSVKLLRKEQSVIRINEIVLWLGGDFISGNIHDELLETCVLRPVDAALYAKNLIVSGINHLLETTKCNLTVVCSPGNHSRITKKTHIATEHGNSLEYYMYKTIAELYNGEKRVKFVIEEGYLTYLPVYGLRVRFHHGHQCKYQGGVGGLTVPLNKSIAQWNKTQWADLDVLGHFHTSTDGGNFMENGSLIGYSPFAVAIKASYEPPKQMFFLIDKKRGKTVTTPILFSV